MIPHMNETIGALLLLLLVLVVAAISTRGVAIVVSLIAFACFNFFFLPPVGTFTIAKKDDFIALFVLLAVSLIGSHLSHLARQRAQVALTLADARNEAEIAKRSAEVKTALVASLSHDLKTPLTALTVSVGNLGMPGLSEEARTEQMRIVRTEVARLQKLFDSLIDMASVETRSVTAELEWVHPSDIIEAACQRAASVLVSHPMDIRDQTAGQVVHLDPRITSAALGHVLENAAIYSPASSPIAVDVRTDGAGLVIAVRDRGPGLPKDDVERIFERFYRGTGVPQNRFSSGMGLAITRGLVAIQGGRIRAANHPEGGALFTLEIPATVKPASPAEVDA